MITTTILMLSAIVVLAETIPYGQYKIRNVCSDLLLNGFVHTSYNSLMEYYYQDYRRAWNDNGYGTYNNDWFTYVLLDTIDNMDGWVYFKDAYREISNLSITSSSLSNTDKYDLLIDTVDRFSGYRFKSSLLNKYSNEVSVAKQANFIK